MGKRPALGRGLAALLGETSDEVSSSRQEERSQAPEERSQAPEQRPRADPAPSPEIGERGIIDLPLSSIRGNPRQPRRAIEPEALEQLAASIAEVGVVQPVIVRPVDGGYELIAGERRWRAARMAGFTVLPAIVRRASDVESLELALIENVVRQELNPVDEAFALKVLLEDLGVTQDTLAARVGKSRSAIANKIRLLDLPVPIQDALARGQLTEGHARALLGLSGQGQQLQLARKVADKGLSVRQVEDEVRRLSTKASLPSPRPPSLDPETVDILRDAFFSSLGVVPRIRPRQGGGVIELPFKNLEELQRIRERLVGSGELGT